MSIEVQQFLNDSGGNFTETAPRPPVPGEENELHSNGGTSTRSSGSYKSHLSAKSHTSAKSHRSDSSPAAAAATPRRSNLDKTSLTTTSLLTTSLSCSVIGVDDVDAPLGFEPEGSAASSPPFTENSSPPYLKWAENLIHLLDDSDGVKLFKQFLDQEQCANTLDFWFACRGLKMVSAKDEPKIHSLVKLIYRKYIKVDQLLLKPDIKKRLVEKLNRKERLDQTIFDEAQKEVEETMRNDSYPLFLKSDLYVQYVQTGGESPKTSNNSSGSNSVRPLSGPLPTVQEGEVLKGEDLFKVPNSTLALTQSALYATQYTRQSPNTPFKRPEGVYLQNQSGRSHVNPYHVSYAPVSAQDSELQSLSSDALTDDTMSLTDSSVDGREAPVYGTSKWKRRQKAMHRNAQINKCAELNQLSVIPRTDRAPKDRNIAEIDPAKFASMLIERLDKVKDEQDKMKRIEDSMKTLEQMTDEEDLNKSSLSTHNKSVSSMMALMATAMAEKEKQDEDNAQSILEEHCSRIWDSSAGQTPSRSPGRHSPERAAASLLADRSFNTRRSMAGPSPNVSGILLGHRPYHKRTKDRLDTSSTSASHLTSLLSFDSGMGGDDKSWAPSSAAGGTGNGAASAASVPTTSSSRQEQLESRLAGNLSGTTTGGSAGTTTGGSTSSKHVHHHHHHHHISGSKDPKLSTKQLLELEAQSRSLSHYRAASADPALRDSFSRSYDETGSRGRSRDTKRSNVKKVSDTSSNIDSGVSVRYEPTGNPANEKVLAWMMENEKMHSSTAQYSTDSSEKSSSYKRSSHSHKSSSGGSRQGSSKKPVQYNASRSGSLDRSLHHPIMSTDYLNLQGHQVLPAQPMVQDPSMPLLTPPNPIDQLEEVRRRLEDECKAKNMRQSRSFNTSLSTKDKRSMPPPLYPASSRSITSGSKPPQALDLSADSETSFSKKMQRRPSTSAPTTPAAGEVTVVGYQLPGDDIPYRTTIPGKSVTLGQFKQSITKRGNFRFFFKAPSDEFGSGVIYEEVTDDGAVLPLWEGKVFGKLEKVD